MSKLAIIFFMLFAGTVFADGMNYATESSKPKYTVEKDLEWASVDGFSLTMDIYTPDTGKDSYPVVVIFHGGGWLINDKSIMDQMSEYMADNGEYVVANVNYRLLVDQENTVRMDQIVEDAFGAILWVKENISQYKGDNNRVAVTGDSAGGHLAAMVINSGRELAEEGFLDSATGFRPSYLPEGKNIAELIDQMEVQAAVLNYPALNLYSTAQGGFETSGNFMWQMAGAQARGLFGEEYNVEDHAAHYKGVSPVFNIPKSSKRKLPPQLITVGSKDDLIKPEMVQEYVRKLKELGHPVEYWEYAGRPHAYLDSGANEFLGTSFEDDAPEALDKMIDFLNEVLK